MTKAPTQKDMFNEIIALAEANGRADIVDFAKGRIEVLAKKSNKTNAKHDAEVEANVALVYEALEAVGSAVTVSELIKGAENEVSEWSTPKASAYLKKLVDSGKVNKTTDKKISRFSIA